MHQTTRHHISECGTLCSDLRENLQSSYQFSARHDTGRHRHSIALQNFYNELGLSPGRNLMNYFGSSHFNIILICTLYIYFSIYLFRRSVLTKVLYAFPVYHHHATCPCHHIRWRVSCNSIPLGYECDIFRWVSHGAFSTADCVASSDNMIDEWSGRDLKGNAHGLIVGLSQHFAGGTEGNHENPQIHYTVSRPRFEPSPPNTSLQRYARRTRSVQSCSRVCETSRPHIASLFNKICHHVTCSDVFRKDSREPR
jgi:hypothetical protein